MSGAAWLENRAARRCHVPSRSGIKATAAWPSALEMAVQMIEHPSAANPITSLWSLSIVALDAVVVVLLIAAHVVRLGVTRLSHTPVNL